MIYERLNGYLRGVYTDELYSSRLSIHEAIKAQLYVFGFKERCLPILEARVKGGRIDCLLLQGQKMVCAIEVDYTIKQKSIEKLHGLLPDAEKIIIAYSSGISAYQKALYRHKDKLNGIRVFRLNRDGRYYLDSI